MTDINLIGGALTAVTQVGLNSTTDVTLFPNPAKDMAYVNLTLSNAANVQVQVLDAVGRVVSTSNQDLAAGSQKIEVSTSNLPTGLYNIKVVVGNNVITKQLSVIN